ncbi:hypothetical protein [Meridianimarinicoccus sp. MJW13]|uniref:hypothetical protein n=1 Tax=Meridianimarinicoccus sp. MJW13 TaxID=2720031 RepID=UPI001866BF18|nr:hypothetical protein [Fluviibacterium sp. MJW13]
MTRKTIAAAALLTAALANPALALERWVRIHNSGNASIWSVQMTHVDDGGWGRDLLENYVIPVGSTATLEPDRHQGYCKFDVRIIYNGGREVELRGVNLCTARDITASDNGYTNVSY